jgi:hypothetical protein
MKEDRKYHDYLEKSGILATFLNSQQ